ncbi:DUF3472 domain-containing protein [Thalassoroseus pseudoceratinae]|uniref:DUF3472 domain-containing protein n=1 Tax=Thalassoroseus pseudoceratinae TaxID=2713176 RepID=UPI00141DA8BE|nr:DUF3472 domain-containing protein [Thalassoroseus pseudoceratinae]
MTKTKSVSLGLTALILAATIVVPVGDVVAGKNLEGIACRSVHLGYPAPEGRTFYNEATIRKSAPGSYFMVCGWNRGYFGLQEIGNGKKVVLFSVWDSGQNNPNAVPAEKRVKILHQDADVRVGRFGGEGSGGQSFFDFDWKIGETYRCMVRATPNGPRTEYAGYFYLPKTKEWKHLVTFSTLSKGQPLRGYYSFVEDFKRNRVSTTHARVADFGSGWVETTTGEWIPLLKARFTGDANPVMNINGGKTSPTTFFLATGGETKNVDTPLREMIELPADQNRKPPEDLPK